MFDCRNGDEVATRLFYKAGRLSSNPIADVSCVLGVSACLRRYGAGRMDSPDIWKTESCITL